MSRRQTPHQKREKSRTRRALDRAIVRAVLDLTWSYAEHSNLRPLLSGDSTAELVGLCLARRRIK